MIENLRLETLGTVAEVSKTCNECYLLLRAHPSRSLLGPKIVGGSVNSARRRVPADRLPRVFHCPMEVLRPWQIAEDELRAMSAKQRVPTKKPLVKIPGNSVHTSTTRHNNVRRNTGIFNSILIEASGLLNIQHYWRNPPRTIH